MSKLLQYHLFKVGDGPWSLFIYAKPCNDLQEFRVWGLGFRVGIASRYILKHMEFDRKSIVDRDYADYSDFKADVHSLWTAMPVFVCCH